MKVFGFIRALDLRFRCDHAEENFLEALAFVLMQASQLRHGAQRNDAALVQDGDAVRKLFGDVEQMSAHQHGHAGAAAGFDLLLHRPCMDGIQAHHGFVDHEDFRVMQKRGGDGEALSGAMAEILDALVRLIREREFLEKIFRGGLRLCRVHLIQVRDELHELGGREFFVKHRHVRHITEEGLRLLRVRLDVVAADCHAASGRFHKAGQEFDGRRFSCAIGTQESKELPLGDGEIQVIQGEEIAVAHGEAFDVDHVESGRFTASPGLRGRGSWAPADASPGGDRRARVPPLR